MGNEHFSFCDDSSGSCSLPQSTDTHLSKKPLELYIFMDPLCPECWAFEPVLKKLLIEYGHYFTPKLLLTSNIECWSEEKQKPVKEDMKKEMALFYEEVATRTGMPADGSVWLKHSAPTAYIPALAMKAAEMQGKQLASVFFRNIRENLFLHGRDISTEQTLVQIAEATGLDIEEFQRDIHSACTRKALNCDIRTSREMEVDQAPAFVFFNDHVEDGGLKVSGLYPYQVYEEILSDMLGHVPEPSHSLTLEKFLSRYPRITTKEVSVVFDWSEKEAEKQLKQLVLMRKMKHVPLKNGAYWEYVPSFT
ncbi:Predicted dithiol-disulfide isomerase, DsbA family [Marinococcus luteus]|uniref:ClpXP adapter protein SpxH n=1 Tax=Marinococcus luteus TaxID=1122204 RepID=A0A1H2VBF6_9BACI|nr:ClpXP adapter SpxH family protein [Marinococcus luteus]SDW65655.1 Predicted dithiol-disulfide isomerase, DsbA family [Marinococcus luteus]